MILSNLKTFKTKIYLLAVILLGLLVLAGCNAIYGYSHMSEVNFNESSGVLKASYTSTYQGGDNTASFMFDEIFNLVNRYKDSKKLYLKIYIESKKGSMHYIGQYPIDSLDFIRSFESKAEYKRKARRQIRKFEEIFVQTFPRKMY